MKLVAQRSGSCGLFTMVSWSVNSITCWIKLVVVYVYHWKMSTVV